LWFPSSLRAKNRPEFSSAGSTSERRPPESARTDHTCIPGRGIGHRTGGPLPDDRRRNGSSSPPRRASEKPTQTATRPGPRNASKPSRCRRERAKRFVKQHPQGPGPSAPRYRRPRSSGCGSAARCRTRWASALILFPAAFTFILNHNRSTNPLRWRSSHPRAAGRNLLPCS
jgi:hypothetical protein